MTFLIGFVIGPQFELSLRQTLIVTDRDPAALLTHPIALAILAVAVLGALFSLRGGSRALSSGDAA